jgi:hypothetical protein
LDLLSWRQVPSFQEAYQHEATDRHHAYTSAKEGKRLRFLLPFLEFKSAVTTSATTAQRPKALPRPTDPSFEAASFFSLLASFLPAEALPLGDEDDEEEEERRGRRDAEVRLLPSVDVFWAAASVSRRVCACNRQYRNTCTTSLHDWKPGMARVASTLLEEEEEEEGGGSVSRLRHPPDSTPSITAK